MDSQLDIIEKLTKLANRYRTEKYMAQARAYDLIYANKPKPTETELKARINYLEGEVKRLVKERDSRRRSNED